MTKYYRSRSLAEPGIYILGEGWWRSHTSAGMRQVEGSIPDGILADVDEITPEEAERLIGRGEQQSEDWKAERTIYSMEADEAAPATPDGAQTFRRRALWTVAAIIGVVVVIAVVVMALAGGFGDGSDAGSTGTSQRAGSDTSASSIVAKVGKHKVTREELDRRVADFEAQYAGRTPDPDTAPDDYKLFQQGVLDYLITYELARQASEALGITITDEEIQGEIEAILETSYGGDQAAFERALAGEGLTMDQLEQSYRESLLLKKVYEEATRGVTAVAEGEIQSYYDQNKSGSYAGKTLEEVSQQIKSLLLDKKKREVWLLWIEQTKQELDVTYEDGWGPVTTTVAPAS
jgi:hypothetical protein